jgi:hypothetical protein
VIAPPQRKLPIEILETPRKSFAGEALKALLESDNFRLAERPQMIILGASGAQEAYRPAVLEPKVGPFQVSNLAIGAANISEMNQALDHCLKALPAVVERKSTLLLGLSYPVFVPDQVRWQHPEFVSPAIVASGIFISDLKREALRSPTILDSENPVFKLLPAPLLSLAKQRCSIWHQWNERLPVSLGEPVTSWGGWNWRLPKKQGGDRSRFQKRERKQKENQQNLDPRKQMDWLTSYMGPAGFDLPAEQFTALIHLIERARGAGMRVIAADMPLPSWHRADSPYVAPYRTALGKALINFKDDPGVSFIDMSGDIPDTGFRDSIHPAATSLEQWTDHLSEKMVPTAISQ